MALQAELRENKGHFKVRGCPVVGEVNDDSSANDGTATPVENAFCYVLECVKV
ncbi:MAG: hypothetical protein L3K26_13525 [Candidatus Hydrogenedentes bacterium]|nr:hypothetical protein [Candidatus Hydrogenedentota bacterium]